MGLGRMHRESRAGDYGGKEEDGQKARHFQPRPIGT
jgi:hypothetical protein